MLNKSWLSFYHSKSYLLQNVSPFKSGTYRYEAIRLISKSPHLSKPKPKFEISKIAAPTSSDKHLGGSAGSPEVLQLAEDIAGSSIFSDRPCSARHEYSGWRCPRPSEFWQSSKTEAHVEHCMAFGVLRVLSSAVEWLDSLLLADLPRTPRENAHSS